MLLWSYFHLLLYWNVKLVLSIRNLFSTEQVWCQEWIPFSAYPGHLFYGPFCTVWVKCSYVEPTVLCLTQVLTEMEMSYWSRCVKTGFKSKDSLQAKRHCFFFSLVMCRQHLWNANRLLYVLRLGPYCELRAKFFAPGILSETVTYSADRENQASKIYSISQGSNRGGDFNATVVWI